MGTAMRKRTKHRQRILTWWQFQLNIVVPTRKKLDRRTSLGSSNTDESAHKATIRSHCLAYVSTLYPSALTIRAVDLQGGCSFTVKIQHGRERDGSSETMLQFRNARFALDMRFVQRVQSLHGLLVPETKRVGHIALSGGSREVYEMTVVPGIRFDSVRPLQRDLDEQSAARIKTLLDGMAAYFASSFMTADTDATTSQGKCSGRIGATLLERLTKLSLDLPADELRSIARSTLDDVQQGAMQCLPVVLTHGDLLPTNIFVDQDTWALTGLVDWAEAEDLPFGIGLYGVDRLLGYMDDAHQWAWYDESGTLRKHFWSCLQERVPALVLKESTLANAVQLARVVGVLLWYGFAWDDGRLDPVVNKVNDRDDVAMLRAFLLVHDSLLQ
ncbi:hypothetical protein LTR95_005603 [Oleoguttula sp. CCFEE 5521]